MADYRRDLVRFLRDQGCEFVRNASGSHELWQSPVNGARFVIQHSIPSRESANSICKQEGLPKSF